MMRFHVKNIRSGYCEIWANERDGGRYGKVATVNHYGIDGWKWTTIGCESFLFDKPLLSKPHKTRRECILEFKKKALMRLVEHAIETQREESPHWHSPRRDALCEVNRSHLFTLDEREEIEKRLVTFE